MIENNLDKAGVYNDFAALKGIKALDKTDKEKALKEVAKQLESHFINIMMKSMRDANKEFQSDLIDNDTMDFYQEMFDQQLSLSMSKSGGIGLSEALVRQLSTRGASEKDTQSNDNTKMIGAQTFYDLNKQASFYSLEQDDQLFPLQKGKQVHALVDSGNKISLMDNKVSNKNNRAEESSVNQRESIVNSNQAKPNYKRYNSPTEFLTAILPDVIDVAKELGVNPKVLAAQAALETGWGKSILRKNDGSLSHNLFNIKAHRGWDKETVGVKTLEYRGGVPRKEYAKFRSYDTFKESLNDYVDFLHSNPRYKTALQKTADPRSYVQALQDAGYATDPNYANKIMKIFSGDMMKLSLSRLNLSK